MKTAAELIEETIEAPTTVVQIANFQHISGIVEAAFEYVDCLRLREVEGGSMNNYNLSCAEIDLCKSVDYARGIEC